ncbi:phage tail assembly protein [Streptomyces fructofermentans]|uniref:Tail assembly chaperone n=1 Tax=Streptomyces fructofermentans TaxID=152141 RepID=A0A918U6L4_9ACTN|nr:phage tail assembly protein [Streptomyces fructofermentans]GGX98574.1 hypothetical protein GCM10010515_75990 [Streptomyces fructofermentans]
MAEATSIEALQAEAEEKYPGLPLELGGGKTVTLKNILRLSEIAQRNVIVLIDSLKSADPGDKAAEGTDYAADLERQKRIVRDLLLLVADDVAAIKDQVEEWDLGLLLLVMEKWQSVTQLPEASGSPS